MNTFEELKCQLQMIMLAKKKIWMELRQAAKISFLGQKHVKVCNKGNFPSKKVSVMLAKAPPKPKEYG